MRPVGDLSRAMAFLFIALLSACSGGGGSSQSNTAVTASTLTFSAASPDAPTPAPQTFTATVNSGTVYLTVIHSGSAIANVTYTLSGTTAQIVVTPPSPGSLGAGVFTGSIAVTGYSCANSQCTSFTSGNTENVNVTYQIPPIVRFVAPYVATSATSGTVIIRGRGFKAFSITGVTFGGTPATSFTVVNDTEIQASYPSAISVGSYPVNIQAPSSPGPITSLANLVVVAPPTYAQATLTYPLTVSGGVQSLLYDAQRQALLVAVNGSNVLRYDFLTTSWASPITTVTGLSDIALSQDGTLLLSLSQTGLTELDPQTLAQETITPAPTSLPTGTVFKNLSIANDGNAIVTTGFSGSTATPLYLYNVRSPAFTQSAISLDNSIPGASADGSLVSISQEDPTLLTSSYTVYQYTALSGSFSGTSVSLTPNPMAPALDRTATRIILNGTSVYSASYSSIGSSPSYQLLGTLPSTTLAVVVKPDATFAYTFDSNGSQVLKFDLAIAPSGGLFTSVASQSPAALSGVTGVKMAISPDGGTLFFADTSNVVVMPAF